MWQVKEGEKFKEDVKRPPAIQTKPPQKDPSADFLAQEYVSSPPALADTPPGKDLFEGRVDGLYLVLISLHGLVRGERMELGKDPDTGGQVLLLSKVQPMAQCIREALYVFLEHFLRCIAHTIQLLE